MEASLPTLRDSIGLTLRGHKFVEEWEDAVLKVFGIEVMSLIQLEEILIVGTKNILSILCQRK